MVGPVVAGIVIDERDTEVVHRMPPPPLVPLEVEIAHKVMLLALLDVREYA